MSRRSNQRDDQLRLALAREAARIMAEQGIEDFLLAKRKAAERLMVGSSVALPRNSEIEAELIEYQRLFRHEHHDQALHELRQSAVQLMRLLHEFQPRLVGSVLSGSATASAEVQLHVFADHSERISQRLEEHGISHRHAEKKLRYAPDRQVNYPSFKFVAGKQAMEVVVFPLDGIRQAPASPVDGKPMPRAELEAVERLLK